MTENNENQGNWNQPWLWITIAPLILSVVLGLTMLTISFQIQDGLVTDEYSKEGLAINQRIEKEEHAKKIQAKATINLDQQAGELNVTFNSTLSELPDNLVLDVVHPIIKDQDIQIVLTQQAPGQYSGIVEQTFDSKRYVRLYELYNPSWILKGEIIFPLEKAAIISAN